MGNPLFSLPTTIRQDALAASASAIDQRKKQRRRSLIRTLSPAPSDDQFLGRSFPAMISG
jgi:hypothetical protein